MHVDKPQETEAREAGKASSLGWSEAEPQEKPNKRAAPEKGAGSRLVPYMPFVVLNVVRFQERDEFIWNAACSGNA